DAGALRSLSGIMGDHIGQRHGLGSCVSLSMTRLNAPCPTLLASRQDIIAELVHRSPRSEYPGGQHFLQKWKVANRFDEGLQIMLARRTPHTTREFIANHSQA